MTALKITINNAIPLKDCRFFWFPLIKQQK
jgi:hypothetical protein